ASHWDGEAPAEPGCRSPLHPRGSAEASPSRMASKVENKTARNAETRSHHARNTRRFSAGRNRKGYRPTAQTRKLSGILFRSLDGRVRMGTTNVRVHVPIDSLSQVRPLVLAGKPPVESNVSTVRKLLPALALAYFCAGLGPTARAQLPSSEEKLKI